MWLDPPPCEEDHARVKLAIGEFLAELNEVVRGATRSCGGEEKAVGAKSGERRALDSWDTLEVEGAKALLSITYEIDSDYELKVRKEQVGTESKGRIRARKIPKEERTAETEPDYVPVHVKLSGEDGERADIWIEHLPQQVWINGVKVSLPQHN